MGRNIFEKYNAVKRSIGTVSLFLAALPLILGADRSLAQAAQNVAKTIISRKDRLELTDFYTNVVQQKIRSELRLNGINDREGSVALVLEFDEQRLTSDATTWYKSLQDNQVINARKQSFSLRSSIKELIASSRADRIKSKPSESSESSEAIPGGLRLGRLNVDISNSVIAEILTSSNRSIDAGSPTALVAQESPVTLAINIPAENGMTVEPYVFKAADYIKKVSLEIILPAVTPKEVVERLPGSLVSLLDLESMSKGANTKEWIKVALAPALPLPIPEVKPEVIATPKSFAKNIWKPENAFLGTLASGLVIGIFILVSMIVGSKAVSKGINTAVSTLGKDIASLKPADDLAKGENSVGSLVGITEKYSNDSRGSFDQTATSHAITHEMQNIRQQMESLIVDQPFLCAEFLRDMFYNGSGLADFRDILSFMGYVPLKPALDQLPKTVVEKLQIFIEENRETPPNILNGAEITQRIYGECIAKATLQVDSMKIYDPVRELLLRTDDVVISKYIIDATVLEIVVLLKTLTVERCNRIIKLISIDRLKEAVAILDKPLENPDRILASIITKVTKIASTLSEQSHSQRRLIFRLVKSIGVSDEAMVYDLVPEADWDLKRQIMSTKLFLKDAIYVPIKHLARGLQDLETTLRAELIIVCSQELRALLTASVGARTKKYEVLQLEVDQIQRNGRRLENIRLREFEILEAFMVSLRNAINGDQAIIDQIILAQAQALGIDPPAGLKIKDKSAA